MTDIDIGLDPSQYLLLVNLYFRFRKVLRKNTELKFQSVLRIVQEHMQLSLVSTSVLCILQSQPSDDRTLAVGSSARI